MRHQGPAARARPWCPSLVELKKGLRTWRLAPGQL